MEMAVSRRQYNRSPMLRAPLPRVFVVFAAVCALAAVATEAGAGLDRAAFLAINHLAAQWLPAWLPSNLTILGHGLVAVMLLAPLLRRAPQVLATALYAAPLATLFSRCGKWLVAAARPAAVLDPSSFHIQGPVLSGHNSFPSGHSITIFLVVSALILADERLRARPIAALGLLCAGLLVASSRIMVGAHWPSDVLGGAALGMLAGTTGAFAAVRWQIWNRAGADTAFALIVLACAAALVVVDTGYPLALPLQWAAAALGAGSATITIAQALRKRPAVPPS